MPVIVVSVVGTIAGLLIAGVGLWRTVRDPRGFLAYGVVALGLVLAGVGFSGWRYEAGDHLPLLLLIGISLGVLLLFNLLGYPGLVVFLIWSGVTILRRESRTLGNGLALLAGIGLLFLPGTLERLAPQGEIRDDPWYMIGYGVHTFAILVVAYFSAVFALFLIGSLLYRWRRSSTRPSAVVVLGSGLIQGEVPPLLGARLRRGVEVQRIFTPAPVLIPSGGQGADEPRSEGEAMAEYLRDELGVPATQIQPETESRTTRENLINSRALLGSKHDPITVVTSSYHVFRAALLTRRLGLTAHVVGARTAWYYLPSAILREFAAVLRDHWKVHALAVLAVLIVAVTLAVVLVPAMAWSP
ncbi:YdcF family protein [Citricoccus muralis]|uniref:YdcF family protein n=1 Tax=Citricoccus muralis TaxID=169134 RepID=A0ABY8HAA5_9MICC|nr:YdcF family protein [Citricoccus muralis]WFP17568.1 YdcF family protein [Citricoccus muralis]